jgi:hypothetical protein
MARAAEAPHLACKMAKFVAIRRTTLADHIRHLPRPKIVQEVLLVGDEHACREIIEKESLKPENQSTDQITVDLYTNRYAGQKSYNSKEIRKDNGKRILRKQ